MLRKDLSGLVDIQRRLKNQPELLDTEELLSLSDQEIAILKPKDTIWNSKLIVTMTGIISVTVLAGLGIITGGAALAFVGSAMGGYALFREATK